jgi:hypothetical protein
MKYRINRRAELRQDPPTREPSALGEHPPVFVKSRELSFGAAAVFIISVKQSSVDSDTFIRFSAYRPPLRGFA